MRAHRGKLDWSKPFKLIDSKAVFDDLDIDNNELVININAKNEHPTTNPAKKEEIIVPKIETVRRITEVKKFAKVDADYLRLTEDLNLPKLESYELNEVDHVFLQGQMNKFKLNGKIVLTHEFLSKAFIELQKKAGKDPVLPRTKQWMTNYVQRQYKQLTTMSNYEQFTEVFYNYWKNRREELKFPMLRQLWHPNPDEYNHLLAFKPREKQKRNLRRNNRLPEDEIAQEMEQQFCLATKIAERIKFRQDLKLKQIELQLSNFHSECKQFFGTPTFFTQFDAESRLRDKEKLKKLLGDAQNVKRLQMQEQQQIQIENIAAISFDQKQSVAEFLSTVVNIAETFGVSYQKLVIGGLIVKPSPTPAPPGPGPLLLDDTGVVEVKHEHMNMNLYRDGDVIYRTFEPIQSDNEAETNYIKSPKDIFQYKARELQLYYYGSDDEGDAKDLKKNISTNFKKFQISKSGSSD